MYLKEIAEKLCIGIGDKRISTKCLENGMLEFFRLEIHGSYQKMQRNQQIKG